MGLRIIDRHQPKKASSSQRLRILEDQADHWFLKHGQTESESHRRFLMRLRELHQNAETITDAEQICDHAREKITSEESSIKSQCSITIETLLDLL